MSGIEIVSVPRRRGGDIPAVRLLLCALAIVAGALACWFVFSIFGAARADAALDVGNGVATPNSAPATSKKVAKKAAPAGGKKATTVPKKASKAAGPPVVRRSHPASAPRRAATGTAKRSNTAAAPKPTRVPSAAPKASPARATKAAPTRAAAPAKRVVPVRRPVASAPRNNGGAAYLQAVANQKRVAELQAAWRAMHPAARRPAPSTPRPSPARVSHGDEHRSPSTGSRRASYGDEHREPRARQPRSAPPTAAELQAAWRAMHPLRSPDTPPGARQATGRCDSVLVVLRTCSVSATSATGGTNREYCIQVGQRGNGPCGTVSVTGNDGERAECGARPGTRGNSPANRWQCRTSVPGQPRAPADHANGTGDSVAVQTTRSPQGSTQLGCAARATCDVGSRHGPASRSHGTGRTGTTTSISTGPQPRSRTQLDCTATCHTSAGEGTTASTTSPRASVSTRTGGPLAGTTTDLTGPGRVRAPDGAAVRATGNRGRATLVSGPGAHRTCSTSRDGTCTTRTASGHTQHVAARGARSQVTLSQDERGSVARTGRDGGETWGETSDGNPVGRCEGENCRAAVLVDPRGRVVEQRCAVNSGGDCPVTGEMPWIEPTPAVVGTIDPTFTRPRVTSGELEEQARANSAGHPVPDRVPTLTEYERGQLSPAERQRYDDAVGDVPQWTRDRASLDIISGEATVHRGRRYVGEHLDNRLAQEADGHGVPAPATDEAALERDMRSAMGLLEAVDAARYQPPEIDDESTELARHPEVLDNLVPDYQPGERPTQRQLDTAARRLNELQGSAASSTAELYRQTGPRTEALDQRASDYTARLDAYNAGVSRLNQRGGGTTAEVARYDAERAALESERAAITTESAELAEAAAPLRARDDRSQAALRDVDVALAHGAADETGNDIDQRYSTGIRDGDTTLTTATDVLRGDDGRDADRSTRLATLGSLADLNYRAARREPRGPSSPLGELRLPSAGLPDATLAQRAAARVARPEWRDYDGDFTEIVVDEDEPGAGARRDARANAAAYFATPEEYEDAVAPRSLDEVKDQLAGPGASEAERERVYRAWLGASRDEPENYDRMAHGLSAGEREQLRDDFNDLKPTRWVSMARDLAEWADNREFTFVPESVRNASRHTGGDVGSEAIALVGAAPAGLMEFGSAAWTEAGNRLRGAMAPPSPRLGPRAGLHSLSAVDTPRRHPGETDEELRERALPLTTMLTEPIHNSGQRWVPVASNLVHGDFSGARDALDRALDDYQERPLSTLLEDAALPSVVLPFVGGGLRVGGRAAVTRGHARLGSLLDDAGRSAVWRVPGELLMAPNRPFAFAGRQVARRAAPRIDALGRRMLGSASPVLTRAGHGTRTTAGYLMALGDGGLPGARTFAQQRRAADSALPVPELVRPPKPGTPDAEYYDAVTARIQHLRTELAGLDDATARDRGTELLDDVDGPGSQAERTAVTCAVACDVLDRRWARENVPNRDGPGTARLEEGQVRSALHLLDGYFVEAQTSAGKTASGGLAAIAQALGARGRFAPDGPSPASAGVHLVVPKEPDRAAAVDLIEPWAGEFGLTVGERGTLRSADGRSQTWDEAVAAYDNDIVITQLAESLWDEQNGVPRAVPDLTIVDEVDQALLDNGMTPHPITGSARVRGPTVRQLRWARDSVRELPPESAFDRSGDRIRVTDDGLRAALGRQRYDRASAGARARWRDLLDNAAAAERLGPNDYFVHRPGSADGEIVLRHPEGDVALDGQRFRNGLHRALEAKHEADGVPIRDDHQHLSSLTPVEFFQDRHLAGMSGTVPDELTELFGRPKVTVSESTLPPRLTGDADLRFLDRDSKLNGIADNVLAGREPLRHPGSARRPVWAIVSPEEIPRLVELLERRLPDTEILRYDSAAVHRNPRAEREILAKARETGAVMVASPRLGRGIHIDPTSAARHAGGPHVIIGEAMSPRGVMQAARRTARGWLNGRRSPGTFDVLTAQDDRMSVDPRRGVHRPEREVAVSAHELYHGGIPDDAPTADRYRGRLTPGSPEYTEAAPRADGTRHAAERFAAMQASRSENAGAYPAPPRSFRLPRRSVTPRHVPSGIDRPLLAALLRNENVPGLTGDAYRDARAAAYRLGKGRHTAEDVTRLTEAIPRRVFVPSVRRTPADAVRELARAPELAERIGLTRAELADAVAVAERVVATDLALTPADRAQLQVFAGYARGASVAETARLHGVSQSTARELLRQALDRITGNRTGARAAEPVPVLDRAVFTPARARRALLGQDVPARSRQDPWQRVWHALARMETVVPQGERFLWQDGADRIERLLGMLPRRAGLSSGARQRVYDELLSRGVDTVTGLLTIDPGTLGPDARQVRAAADARAAADREIAARWRAARLAGRSTWSTAELRAATRDALPAESEKDGPLAALDRLGAGLLPSVPPEVLDRARSIDPRRRMTGDEIRGLTTAASGRLNRDGDTDLTRKVALVLLNELRRTRQRPASRVLDRLHAEGAENWLVEELVRRFDDGRLTDADAAALSRIGALTPSAERRRALARFATERDLGLTKKDRRALATALHRPIRAGDRPAHRGPVERRPAPPAEPRGVADPPAVTGDRRAGSAAPSLVVATAGAVATPLLPLPPLFGIPAGHLPPPALPWSAMALAAAAGALPLRHWMYRARGPPRRNTPSTLYFGPQTLRGPARDDRGAVSAAAAATMAAAAGAVIVLTGLGLPVGVQPPRGLALGVGSLLLAGAGARALIGYAAARAPRQLARLLARTSGHPWHRLHEALRAGFLIEWPTGRRPLSLRAPDRGFPLRLTADSANGTRLTRLRALAEHLDALKPARSFDDLLRAWRHTGRAGPVFGDNDFVVYSGLAGAGNLVLIVRRDGELVRLLETAGTLRQSDFTRPANIPRPGLTGLTRWITTEAGRRANLLRHVIEQVPSGERLRWGLRLLAADGDANALRAVLDEVAATTPAAELDARAAIRTLAGHTDRDRAAAEVAEVVLRGTEVLARPENLRRSGPLNVVWSALGALSRSPEHHSLRELLVRTVPRYLSGTDANHGPYQRILTPAWLVAAFPRGAPRWLRRWDRLYGRDRLTFGLLAAAYPKSTDWLAALPKRHDTYAKLARVLWLHTDPELRPYRDRLRALLTARPEPLATPLVQSWLELADFVVDIAGVVPQTGQEERVLAVLDDVAAERRTAGPDEAAGLVAGARERIVRSVPALAVADLPDFWPGSDLWNALIVFRWRYASPLFADMLDRYAAVLARTRSRETANRAARAVWREWFGPEPVTTALDEAPRGQRVRIDGVDTVIGASRDVVETLHLGHGMRDLAGIPSCVDCTGNILHPQHAQGYVLHPELAVVYAWQTGTDGMRVRVGRVSVALTDAGLLVLSPVYAPGAAYYQLAPAFGAYLVRWAERTGRALLQPAGDERWPGVWPDMPDGTERRTLPIALEPSGPGLVYTDVTDVIDGHYRQEIPVLRWRPGGPGAPSQARGPGDSGQARLAATAALTLGALAVHFGLTAPALVAGVVPAVVLLARRLRDRIAAPRGPPLRRLLAATALAVGLWSASAWAGPSAATASPEPVAVAPSDTEAPATHSSSARQPARPTQTKPAEHQALPWHRLVPATAALYLAVRLVPAWLRRTWQRYALERRVRGAVRDADLAARGDSAARARLRLRRSTVRLDAARRRADHAGHAAGARQWWVPWLMGRLREHGHPEAEALTLLADRLRLPERVVRAATLADRDGNRPPPSLVEELRYADAESTVDILAEETAALLAEHRAARAELAAAETAADHARSRVDAAQATVRPSRGRQVPPATAGTPAERQWHRLATARAGLRATAVLGALTTVQLFVGPGAAVPGVAWRLAPGLLAIAAARLAMRSFDHAATAMIGTGLIASGALGYPDLGGHPEFAALGAAGYAASLWFQRGQRTDLSRAVRAHSVAGLVGSVAAMVAVPLPIAATGVLLGFGVLLRVRGYLGELIRAPGLLVRPIRHGLRLYLPSIAALGLQPTVHSRGLRAYLNGAIVRELTEPQLRRWRAAITASDEYQVVHYGNSHWVVRTFSVWPEWTRLHRSPPERVATYQVRRRAAIESVRAGMPVREAARFAGVQPDNLAAWLLPESGYRPRVRAARPVTRPRPTLTPPAPPSARAPPEPPAPNPMFRVLSERVRHDWAAMLANPAPLPDGGPVTELIGLWTAGIAERLRGIHNGPANRRLRAKGIAPSVPVHFLAHDRGPETLVARLRAPGGRPGISIAVGGEQNLRDVFRALITEVYAPAAGLAPVAGRVAALVERALPGQAVIGMPSSWLTTRAIREVEELAATRRLDRLALRLAGARGERAAILDGYWRDLPDGEHWRAADVSRHDAVQRVVARVWAAGHQDLARRRRQARRERLGFSPRVPGGWAAQLRKAAGVAAVQTGLAEASHARTELSARLTTAIETGRDDPHQFWAPARSDEALDATRAANEHWDRTRTEFLDRLTPVLRHAVRDGSLSTRAVLAAVREGATASTRRGLRGRRAARRIGETLDRDLSGLLDEVGERTGRVGAGPVQPIEPVALWWWRTRRWAAAGAWDAHALARRALATPRFRPLRQETTRAQRLLLWTALEDLAATFAERDLSTLTDPEGMLRELRELGVSDRVAAEIGRTLEKLGNTFDVHLHMKTDYAFLRAYNFIGRLRDMEQDGHLGRLIISPIPQRGRGTALAGGSFYYLVASVLRAGIVRGEQMLSMGGKFSDVALFDEIRALPANLRWKPVAGFTGLRTDIPGALDYLKAVLVANPDLADVVGEFTFAKEAVTRLLGPQAAHVMNPAYESYVERLLTGITIIAGERAEHRAPPRWLADVPEEFLRLLPGEDGTAPAADATEAVELLVRNAEWIRVLLGRLGHGERADRSLLRPGEHTASAPDRFDPRTRELLAGSELTGQLVIIHNDAGLARLAGNGLYRAGPPDERYFLPLMGLLAEYPRANVIVSHMGLGKFTTLSLEHVAALRHTLAADRERRAARGLGRDDFPRLLFDLSWSDVLQHIYAEYVADGRIRRLPEIRAAFVDLAGEFDRNFVSGSDNVNPETYNQYLRHHVDATPIFRGVAEKYGPETIERIRHRNAAELLAAVRVRTSQWAFDEIASGAWDEFIDQLRPERRRLVRDWFAAERAAGRQVTRPATGPGDWRASEQILSLLGWHNAIEPGGVSGREGWGMRLHAAATALHDRLLRKHNEKIRRRSPQGLEPTGDTARLGMTDRAGRPLTVPALLAAQHANEVTTGWARVTTDPGTPADWPHRVLEAVQETETEADRAERSIAERHRRQSRAMRVFSRGLLLTSVAVAGLAVTTRSAAFASGPGAAMAALAFLARGLATQLRTGYAERTRKLREGAIEDGEHTLTTTGWLADQTRRNLRYEIPAHRGSPSPVDYHRIVADFDTWTWQAHVDQQALRHLPLLPEETVTDRERRALSEYSASEDKTSRLVGVTATSLIGLNPHTGFTGRLIQAVITGSLLVNLYAHLGGALVTSGLDLAVNVVFLIADVALLRAAGAVLAAGLAGFDHSSDRRVRRIQHLIALPALTLGSALLTGQLLLATSFARAMVAAMLTGALSAFTLDAWAIELRLGRRGRARRAFALASAVNLALIGLGITGLAELGLPGGQPFRAVLAGLVVYAVAGLLNHPKRGEWLGRRPARGGWHDPAVPRGPPGF